MAQIRVNPEGLRQNASAISGKISELQSLNTRLTSLISSIDSSWDGEASQVYITTMSRYAEKARSMVDVLQELKRYMEQAASRFEQKDRDGANRIRNA